MFEMYLKGEVRNVSVKEFTRRNGDKDVAYNMLLEGRTGSRMIPVTKGIYEDFVRGSLEKGNCIELCGEYNPQFQYNQFVVEDYKIVS